MTEMADEFRKDLEGAEGDASSSDDTDGDTNDEAADVAGESDGDQSGSGSDDTRSWQSRADKADARANKAEKELAAFKADGKGVTAKPSAPPSGGGADPWVEASKGNFREELFRSDTRFKELGFEQSLIQGTTPAEMKKSFESLQKTVDKMTTGIRNRVLQEHGLEPVPGSGERASTVNYNTMSSEEFEKAVDRALSQ